MVQGLVYAWQFISPLMYCYKSYLASNSVERDLRCLSDNEGQCEAHGTAQASPCNDDDLLPIDGVANVHEQRSKAANHNKPGHKRQQQQTPSSDTR